MGRKKVPINFRILSKTIISASGCLIWQGSCGAGGYGRMEIDGKQKLTHRVSFETFNYPIPKALDVLHKCDNPPCLRPDHLFLGTKKENMRDKIIKGRDRGPVAENRLKKLCKYGHKLVAENLYIKKNGSRNCVKCQKRINKERYNK